MSDTGTCAGSGSSNSTSSNAFLAAVKENSDLNQYWYSQRTISTVIQELQRMSSIAFLSTPSLYFSLDSSSQLKSSSWVFDFDKQWATDPHFVEYDFNCPDKIPLELHHKFDCVVIDPPFICSEVWQKYAVTARLLLAPGGKVLASTIAENKDMMQHVLGVSPCQFRPSIPNLIYQYSFFANFEPVFLNEDNPEVDSD